MPSGAQRGMTTLAVFMPSGAQRGMTTPAKLRSQLASGTTVKFQRPMKMRRGICTPATPATVSRGLDWGRPAGKKPAAAIFWPGLLPVHHKRVGPRMVGNPDRIERLEIARSLRFGCCPLNADAESGDRIAQKQAWMGLSISEVGDE
jgi:hypothetical protein